MINKAFKAPLLALNMFYTASLYIVRPDQKVAISSRPPTEGVPRIAQPNPHPNPSPNLWIPTHSSIAPPIALPPTFPWTGQ